LVAARGQFHPKRLPVQDINALKIPPILPIGLEWRNESEFRAVVPAGGADIALYVCAPVIASLSRAPSVHENRIVRMSTAVGAQGATVQWGRRHTRQCLRHPRPPAEMSDARNGKYQRPVFSTTEDGTSREISPEKTLTFTAEQYGLVQQQYVVTDPDFYPQVPSPATLNALAVQQVIEKVSPTLRAPYLMQSAVAFERQLPAHTTVAVTFADTHGLHQLRSQDINAPLPGTYDPQVTGSGVFPLGNPDSVFLMESAGLYNQTQLITNFNSQASKNVSLFGSYLYNHAMSNTDSLGTFPANPYSMAGEYGPAATDIRNRVTLGGSISTRWGFRFNPFLVANSGPPFDITAGQDLYGDTLFNARPGLPTNTNKLGLIATKYGLLDPDPSLGERILPRNYGRGPGIVLFNLRVSKTFAFGGRERGGGSSGAPGGYGSYGRRVESGPFNVGGPRDNSSSSDRRYTLIISMAIRNILNRNNPGPIIGNIESPSFGQANQPYGVGSWDEPTSS